MKISTPTVVPTTAVPRWSAVRAVGGRTNAVGHLVIDLGRRFVERRAERGPHGDAQKRHDEDSDGGGDHPFPALLGDGSTLNRSCGAARGPPRTAPALLHACSFRGRFTIR